MLLRFLSVFSILVSCSCHFELGNYDDDDDEEEEEEDTEISCRLDYNRED